MSIQVLRAGLLTSIQDLGRQGYQKYGVIVNGGMDSYSLRIANLLVGNEEGEGVLEITLLGPSLQVAKHTLLAITGGNLSPTINGQPVPMWRPVYIQQDSILNFGACQSGCRSYLAVAGGYDILKIMGSKSTYLRAGIGGFQGRALQAGDTLPLGCRNETAKQFIQQLASKKTRDSFLSTPWYAEKKHIPRDAQNIMVRITRGNQFEQFTANSQQQFLDSAFQVKTQSDRMGYRLAGPILALANPLEMISEAVTFGTVQVPPDGNPIILLADRQTAGGYPKIAQVAIADLPSIAQARPGNNIRFQEISLETAERLYLKKENDIQQIKTAIRLKFA